MARPGFATAAESRPDRETMTEKALAQDESEAFQRARLLKAVAHPLRLRIVAMLCGGEEHVTGLAEMLRTPQAIVSQQLRILRMHDLVAVSRENGFARYRVLEPLLRDLLSCMEKCEPR